LRQGYYINNFEIFVNLFLHAATTVIAFFKTIKIFMDFTCLTFIVLLSNLGIDKSLFQFINMR